MYNLGWNRFFYSHSQHLRCHQRPAMYRSLFHSSTDQIDRHQTSNIGMNMNIQTFIFQKKITLHKYIPTQFRCLLLSSCESFGRYSPCDAIFSLEGMSQCVTLSLTMQIPVTTTMWASRLWCNHHHQNLCTLKMNSIYAAENTRAYHFSHWISKSHSSHTTSHTQHDLQQRSRSVNRK